MSRKIQPYWLKYEIEIEKDILCKDCLPHPMAMYGAAMTEWYCNHCGDKHVSSSTYTHLICWHCAANRGICMDCKAPALESTKPLELRHMKPEEWMKTWIFEKVTILDRDGWKTQEEWEKPIGLQEMHKRLMICTLKRYE